MNRKDEQALAAINYTLEHDARVSGNRSKKPLSVLIELFLSRWLFVL